MTLLFLRRFAIALCLSASAPLNLACSSDESDPQRSTGGSSGGGAASGGQPSSSGGPSNVETVGSFKITLKAPTSSNIGYTEVLGGVYAWAYPEDTVWTLAESQGGCDLLTPSVPFCDPACTGGAVCVEGGECVASPAKKSVGTVTVRGVATASGETEFTLTEVRGNYQNGPSLGTLPYPPFSAGDIVSVTASGGDLPGFTLEAHGIEPLELTTPEPVPVKPEEPVELAWTPPSSNTSRVEVKLEISHHGGIKGMITCEVPDSGSLTIPAPLVTELIALGVAGFPTVSLTRVDSDETTLDVGRVELLVVSSSSKPVEIPGLISCGEEMPCPDDMTCTIARKCE
jgi:hypothetical protein